MNKIIQGNALEKLKELPEKSINMCMTSPPYWALRDYGTDVETIWDEDKNCEHNWGEGIISAGSRTNDSNSDSFQKESKGSINRDKRPLTNFCIKCGVWKGQLGLEPTFDLYIKHLCDIFDEVKRVLRNDGTCWVNLGDTYYGGGGSAGHTEETKNLGYKTKSMGAIAHNWKRPSREEYTKGTIKKNCLECDKVFYGKENSQFCSRECLNKQGNDFRSQNRLLPDKCLTMIPFRFAIEMVNRGWILRNTIIWHKRNCMPSSVKDRFTVDFEYLFFFSKKKKYYFETQYEPHLTNENRPEGVVRERTLKYQSKRNLNPKAYKSHSLRAVHGGKTSPDAYNPLGRNKRTVWTINPKPFKEAHFAVYPEELCETPIKAGCPEFVCVKCGKPKEVIEKIDYDWQTKGKTMGERQKTGQFATIPGHATKKVTKLGYKPTCSCNTDFTGGIVLDPFFGAGTTGVVALKQNKKFIGIELNKEYIEIANKRLKPLLTQTKLI